MMLSYDPRNLPVFEQRHTQLICVHKNITSNKNKQSHREINHQTTTKNPKSNDFVHLRQRGSYSQQQQSHPTLPVDKESSTAISPLKPSTSTNDYDMEETGFSQRLLMGPHRFDSNLNLDFSISSEDDPKRAPNNDSCTIGRFRSRAQMIVHFLMELHMLRRDVKVLVFGLSWQWIHSVFTNLAYYYQAKLSAIQRQPLQDVAFDLLPTLNGKLWMASEYLVYSMVLVVVVSVFLILFVQFRAPHGRPLYCIPILRRMLLTLVVCQSLRIVSFMCTTLPGASRQCLYKIQHNITLADLMSGPAPPQGNPDRWKPPDTVWDILFRMDPTNGCGDLMFSSHTIFTMLFVCVIWRYFSWKPLKTVMLLCQVR